MLARLSASHGHRRFRNTSQIGHAVILAKFRVSLKEKGNNEYLDLERAGRNTIRSNV